MGMAMAWAHGQGGAKGGMTYRGEGENGRVVKLVVMVEEVVEMEKVLVLVLVLALVEMVMMVMMVELKLRMVAWR